MHVKVLPVPGHADIGGLEALPEHRPADYWTGLWLRSPGQSTSASKLVLIMPTLQRSLAQRPFAVAISR